MNTITVNEKLFFILVRDARLDGYKNTVEYLKEEYKAILENSNRMLFQDDKLYTLFLLTYSGYI